MFACENDSCQQFPKPLKQTDTNVNDTNVNEKNFKDRAISELMAKAAYSANQHSSGVSTLDKMLREIEQAAASFGVLNDPNYVYALSNIETD